MTPPFAGPPPVRPHPLTAAAILLCVLLVTLAAPARGEPVPRWAWPLPPPHPVLRPFEQPEHTYAPGHRGIDLAGAGTAVTAVEAGTVRYAGVVAGRPVISVLHADGLISTYEPVIAEVGAGDRVTAGQVLGELTSGHDGCDVSLCLHLGARRGTDTYLDPLVLLGERGPSVLLPLGGGSPPGPPGPAGTRSVPVTDDGDVLPATRSAEGTCPLRAVCALAL